MEKTLFSMVAAHINAARLWCKLWEGTYATLVQCSAILWPININGNVSKKHVRVFIMPFLLRSFFCWTILLLFRLVVLVAVVGVVIVVVVVVVVVHQAKKSPQKRTAGKLHESRISLPLRIANHTYYIISAEIPFNTDRNRMNLA